MNNLEKVTFKPANESAYQLVSQYFSNVELQIRFMKLVLHISYNLSSARRIAKIKEHKDKKTYLKKKSEKNLD